MTDFQLFFICWVVCFVQDHPLCWLFLILMVASSAIWQGFIQGLSGA